MRFKVDDEVRCVTREGSNYFKNAKYSTALGHTYTVKEVSKGKRGQYIHLWESENELGEFSRCFELVRPACLVESLELLIKKTKEEVK